MVFNLFQRFLISKLLGGGQDSVSHNCIHFYRLVNLIYYSILWQKNVYYYNYTLVWFGDFL